MSLTFIVACWVIFHAVLSSADFFFQYKWPQVTFSTAIMLNSQSLVVYLKNVESARPKLDNNILGLLKLH